MPLKVVVDNLETEVEDEAVRSLYVETDIKDSAGKPKKVFVLALEGVEQHPAVRNLKAAHETVKRDKAKLVDEITTLKETVGGLPEGFTTEEWERLKTVAEAAEADPDNKDITKKLADQAAALNARWQGKMDTAVAKVTKERDDAVAKLDGERGGRRKDLAERELAKAVAQAGITDPDMADAAIALLRDKVEVTDDDGNLRVNAKAENGGDSVEDFVKGWSNSDKGKKFVTPAKGGDGSGGGPKLDTKDNPFSKISWNMTAQGQLKRSDAAKADRLAKVAGHKDAVSARKENAK